MPLPFALDRGRIRFDGAVLVYLERTLVPDRPSPPGAVPRSYGSAPAAVVDGVVVAAVDAGEAVWLGFQAIEPAHPATLRVRINGPEPLDAIAGGRWRDDLAEEPRNHLIVPPESRLPSFDATDFTVICCSPVRAEAEVKLVGPEEFTRRTGAAPAPLDPSSAYEGWRLP